jgi:hypothetical protein
MLQAKRVTPHMENTIVLDEIAPGATIGCTVIDGAVLSLMECNTSLLETLSCIYVKRTTNMLQMYGWIFQKIKK